MANSPASKNSVGLYISPKEISIAQTRLKRDGKMEAEHLVRIPTAFKAKEGLLRPLSLNGDFFDEKAPWLEAFRVAVKKVNWGSSNVVVTLSPQFAILRYFVMPLVERRFWSKSIPIESKKYIPVSFDEVVYDFAAYPLEGGKKLGVLFGLTQRKSVEFILNILKASGMELTAIEVAPCSVERFFSFLDPREHSSKGYIHFSGGASLMLFSSAGYPVLYREADYEAASTMSERKRLDVKGAVQFVDRYVGGQEYKHLMLSGDGVAVWKPVAEHESPMPVEVWEPAQAASLKENDSSSFFAMGASMRGRVTERLALDISGISSAAMLEKQVQASVWNIAFILGGLLLALSLLSQVRIMLMESEISAIKGRVGNVPELEGGSSELIAARIEKMQADVKLLSVLVSNTDFLAPKLQAVAENIPSDLWLSQIQYSGPFAISEMQSTALEMKLSGETSLTGDMKQRMVEGFNKNLKNSPQFKIFSPPTGGMEFMTEAEGGGGYNERQDPALKTTGFSILCTVRRKS
ncbi:MAG: hypothetical protein WCW52_04335 [Elusimicrobiales bacterium]|jgi:hypothetical protein